ncbi:MAG: class I tRNA ligase family protein [Patescibacteria group bacterium]
MDEDEKKPASTQGSGEVKSVSALREEAVLQFWKENNIFEKSLEKSSPKGEFVFYEGPPTANGKPGIHHLEARAFKDVIPRYKTMQGYHVRRKAGWDTHGLPVELEVEKELGLKSKKEIEEFGIAEFNERCKKSVWKYLDLWNVFTERIGYWIDQKNPYITYDKNYMESVWNVIKTISDRKLLYKDYKVVPWCPRCGTALSSHELAQGYEIVKDLSVYVKFKVKGQENTYILAWTTTPWTLPGNVALAVGENIDYVKIQIGNEFFILAKNRLSLAEGEQKIVEELKGRDLIGLEYESLYPYLQNTISEGEKIKLGKAYKVYSASFITTEDGTGVVHTAVMYGQDDFELGTKIGLPKHHLVGLDGKFLTGTGFLEGRFVRDEEVAVDIIKDLAHRGLLLKKEKYEHPYPHCWRCKTALIYYARDSWYVKMSALRDKLVAENNKINWEPEYTKEGRFGEWLREVKDWAISRERYWGTPLPVWICENCEEKDVIGSMEDLKEKVKKSGNKYFVIRHGGAESNLTRTISSKVEDIDHLTEDGKKQVLNSIKKIKSKKINLIISSDFMRTKETAEVIKNELNFSNDNLIFDKRIRELNAGAFDEGSWNNYPHFWKAAPEGSESFAEVKKRVGNFLYEIEEKYKNKNILIVTHDAPSKLMFSIALGLNMDEVIKFNEHFNHFQNAELRDLPFIPLSHNDDFELDLHKPYIDKVKLVCTRSTGSGQACGGEMNRVKEVMDVWFDSGTMPFSQDHYPFEKEKNILYPADYIAEAIDQTRGWFYTLLAVGVLMGRGAPYKNVICLGHILDAEGKKMSKSIGNVIDPWIMIEKYGVDTLRLWMYSINQPGESKNFDEKTVMELHRQYFGLLYNVLAFYELYRDKDLEKNSQPKSNNILDKWILAKLDELNVICISNLDKYRLLEPSRAIKDFIGDLSTWYLRRSRERIKNGDADALGRSQSGEAKITLYFVLKTLAKIMAPFAPFTAEDIWLKLKTKNDVESAHLANWPRKKFNFLWFYKSKILEKMETVRNITTLGLEARQKAGIKVRQPLNRIEIIAEKLSNEYIEIIKDELNIKNIDYLIKVKIGLNKVNLDTKITPELKEEGNYREFVRALQDMRKKIGLTPSDIISLSIETNNEGKKLVQKFESEIKKTILAKNIEFLDNKGEEVKVDDLVFKISIQK